MIKKCVILSALLLWLILPGFAQTDYSNHAGLSQRVNNLARANPQLVKVKSLTKTMGGKDVWLLTIGTGDVANKPAIAVVGGVEGSHLLGSELAIAFAENLMKNAGTDSIKNVLASTTFYILPNVNPDASEQYFSRLKYERSGNARPTDDDRDGRMNEDGFEDLNGDGLITWVRIEDPTGKYKIHPDDPRIMVLADVAKGEKGTHIVISEGIDNDKDGVWNEDGEGGVSFNKNMTYNYPAFTPGAGEHAVSELETRAALDFLFEEGWNITTVMTFGPTNNLSEPVKFNPQAVARRILSGYLEFDAKVNAMVSDRYNKITGTKEAPKTTPGGGDFSQWVYFHYGRNSFSTPGWWVPKMKLPADSTKNLKERNPTDDNTETNYLRWAESKGLNNVFVPWTSINHPDFPGKKAEAGGIVPFVQLNPPISMVADIAKKHTDFIIDLAKMQPQIEIIDLKTEKLTGGLTRITAKVYNKGALATHSKLGERSKWMKRVKVTLNTTGNQTIISGRKIELFPTVNAGEVLELSWIVKGSGRASIEVGAPHTGFRKAEVNL